MGCGNAGGGVGQHMVGEVWICS
eukprot:COSAG05_NODE_29240_length_110_cov_225.454545_1_plen_22_part_10